MPTSQPETSTAIETPQAPPPKRPRGLLRRLCGWALDAAGYAGLLMFAAAVIVRLTVQDRAPLSVAYFYYATPPAALTLLALGLFVVWLLRRRYRRLLVAVALVVIAGVWTMRTSWFHTNPPPAGPSSFKVFYWNVCHGMLGWQGVVARVRASDADVVALVEDGRNPGQRAAFWKHELPDYYVATFDTGLALLSKQPIDVRAQTGLASWGRFADCVVPIDGRELHVIVTDLTGIGYHVRRGVALAPLYKYLPTVGDEPILVVGDFNTPHDSEYLAPLRRSFVEAFEVAGNGYAATWPWPLPVLWIDHAWVNSEIEVNACTYGWSRRSDHRPVEMTLTLQP